MADKKLGIWNLDTGLPDGYVRPLLTRRQGPPMREIKRFDAGVAAAFADTCGNGDGTVYRAALVNNGHDAWFELYRYTGDLRTELDSMRLDPAPEPPTGAHKGDFPTVSVVRYPDGRAAVRLEGQGHWTAESTGRPYIWSAVDVLDMGAVFDPNNPKHYLAEPIDAQAPEPNPAPSFTLAEVEALFNRVLDAKLTAFLGTLRPHIMQKVEQLFRNGDDGGSVIVWAQLVNTSYTGCIGALRSLGFSEQEAVRMAEAAMGAELELARNILASADLYAVKVEAVNPNGDMEADIDRPVSLEELANVGRNLRLGDAGSDLEQGEQDNDS